MSTEPMSNAMLVASLRGILPDLRRVRERLLGVGAQADAGLLGRLNDEQGVTDLYAVTATVRELSRSGEKRVASVQSNLYNNASAALRRAFQRAYDLGSREARTVAQLPVSGRPTCCQDAALESGVFWYGGGWCARFNISPRRIDFCPFCGARLPEVMP